MAWAATGHLRHRNIVPKDTAEMVHAALDNDWKRARELHQRLFRWRGRRSSRPTPSHQGSDGDAGMIEPEFRLPMCRMSDANRETLRGVLKQYGLVK